MEQSEDHQHEEVKSQVQEDIKPSKNIKSKQICIRCKKAKPTLVFRTDYYCSPCFIQQFESKVINSLSKIQRLGKTDLSKKELTLLCLSGGTNSIAMVRAITGTQEENQKYRRSYSSIVLHIDERCIYPDTSNPDQDLALIKKFVEEECQLKLIVKKLEDIFEGDSKKVLQLLDFFNELGSYREDLIYYMKLHLILQCASELNVQNIQIGASGQRVASKLLSSFVKGRGINLCGEIADMEEFKYNDKNFNICRPMKAHLNKEILSYLYARKILKYLVIRRKQLCDYNQKLQNQPGQGSIDRLTEDFVDQIQHKFTSSVYTAINTSQKVVRKFELEERCPICLGHIDKIVNQLEIKSYEDMNQKNQVFDNEVLQVICYGCKKIMLNAKYWKGTIQELVQYFPKIMQQNLISMMQKHQQYQHQQQQQQQQQENQQIQQQSGQKQTQKKLDEQKN